MITVNGVKVETPKYKEGQWICPKCGKEVEMQDESISFYYTKCECGCIVANKNLLEARAE